MGKIIRLTESDLTRLVRKVIMEQMTTSGGTEDDKIKRNCPEGWSCGTNGDCPSMSTGNWVCVDKPCTKCSRGGKTLPSIKNRTTVDYLMYR